jgi:putative ABC transport system permease protein
MSWGETLFYALDPLGSKLSFTQSDTLFTDAEQSSGRFIRDKRRVRKNACAAPNQRLARFRCVARFSLCKVSWPRCDGGRTMSIVGFFDSLNRDLRYAFRSLSRRPGFTFAVVVTFALGIGATTAIFSVVYSVLIKPLAYPDSDELIRIRHGSDRGEISATRGMYSTYRAENRTFANVGI